MMPAARSETALLGDRLAQIETSIDRAMHEFLSILRDFDAAGGWHADGATSCAAWLSWRIGLGPAAARERLRVARALADLPAIDAALEAGELSYSKVRALTRVADADTEELLLSSARAMTSAQLEKLCGSVRRAAGSGVDRLEGLGGEPEPERYFRQRTAENGMVRLSVQLTADEAAVVTSALDALADTPNRRAEGLVALAETSLRGNARQRTPTEVVVHIDAESLGDAAGTTAEGVVLSRETCRRLLCDAGVVPALEERGKTVDIGRRTRTIPAAIRRAMTYRDAGCRFPGCEHQLIEGHHIDHWGDGGSTSLDNLISLCRRHHRLVHEGRVRIERVGSDGDLDVDFYTAEGRLLPLVPDRPFGTLPASTHLDPWVGCSTHDGSPFDMSWVADITASAMNRARSRNALRYKRRLK